MYDQYLFQDKFGNFKSIGKISISRSKQSHTYTIFIEQIGKCTTATRKRKVN